MAFLAVLLATPLALGLGSASPAAASGLNGTIEIGNVGTLSGPLGPNNTPVEQGVEAWVAYINTHGGLAGRKVVLHTADDTGSPTTFDLLSQQQVQTDHVVAFVGDEGPGTVQGGTAYLEKVGVPVIGGSNENPSYQTSPDFFNTVTNADYMDQYDIINALQKFYPSEKKIGVVYCSTIEACTVIPGQWKVSAPQLGEDLVYSAAAPLTQVDFTTYCLAAKSAGAQAVYVVEGLQAESTFGKNCQAQGYNPTVIIDTSAVSPALIANGGSSSNGAVGVAQVLPGWTPGAQLAPLRAFLKTTPQQTNTAALLGWEAGVTLQYAAKYLPKTGTITPKEVTAALHKINGSTLGGLTAPLKFGQPGKANPGTNCYYPVEVKNGKWTTYHNGAYVCPPTPKG